MTLARDGPADLDLSVVCPSGLTDDCVQQQERPAAACLDIDMNNGLEQQRPADRACHLATSGRTARRVTGSTSTISQATRRRPRPAFPTPLEIKIGDDVERAVEDSAVPRPAAPQLFRPGPPAAASPTFVDSFLAIGCARRSPSSRTQPEKPEAPPLPKDPDDTVVERDGADLPLTDAIERGVVLIVALRADPTKAGIGSGFLISDRRVVTNRHVIEGATEVMIIGEGLAVRARPR